MIFETFTTQKAEAEKVRKKSRGQTSSSLRMNAMSERCRLEHRREERTTPHQMENSDLISWSLMMLIQSSLARAERRLIADLSSCWMKWSEERLERVRWSSSEMWSMKMDSFRDLRNTSRTIHHEWSSILQSTMKQERSFGIDLWRLMQRLRNSIKVSRTPTKNTRVWRLRGGDSDQSLSVRIIFWFRMC